jgi:PAS domain-containing protein
MYGKFRNLFSEPTIGAIINNFRDITVQKEAEEKLEASEHRNKSIVDAMPGYALQINRNEIIVNTMPTQE